MKDNLQMTDVIGEYVEIRIRSDGKVVWINVDGICRCRVCNVKEIEIIDERK